MTNHHRFWDIWLRDWRGKFIPLLVWVMSVEESCILLILALNNRQIQLPSSGKSGSSHINNAFFSHSHSLSFLIAYFSSNARRASFVQQREWVHASGLANQWNTVFLSTYECRHLEMTGLVCFPRPITLGREVQYANCFSSTFPEPSVVTGWDLWLIALQGSSICREGDGSPKEKKLQIKQPISRATENKRRLDLGWQTEEKCLRGSSAWSASAHMYVSGSLAKSLPSSGTADQTLTACYGMCGQPSPWSFTNFLCSLS